MTDSMVTRLRERAGKNDPLDWHRELELEAATKIERLLEANYRLMTIARYVYEDLRKEAWEEADAYIRSLPSPSGLPGYTTNREVKP